MKTERSKADGLLRHAAAVKLTAVLIGFVAIAVVIAFVPGRSSAVLAPQGGVQTVLHFTTMAGVDDAFINNTVVRGVKGDELPWDVGTVDGTLSSDGHLQLNVTGIVFSDDPRVPPELRGINDEDEFRGVVSCLTNRADSSGDDSPGRGHGQVVTKNIFTEGFPATRSGNSNIDANVTLPNPCVAPIVFVAAGSENKWFAVTGSYEEE
jgi:hypothetical protein